jgi:Fur family transcriptional regulator, ferric uptake regulator
MKKSRNTTARSHIQELLLQSDVALSQPEIYGMSEEVCDRVTTYRVLDRLLQDGIVHKTVGLDGVVKYAACRTCQHEEEGSHHHHAHDHVHFNCESCGQVTCLENVVPEIRLPRKYKVHETNYTLSGICPECR